MEEYCDDYRTPTENDVTDLQLVTIHRVASDIDDLDDQTMARLLEKRTQIGSDTGFLMIFSPLKHARFGPETVSELANNKYPVPRDALESLPAHIRARLEQDGRVQFFAEYDSEEHVYQRVTLPSDDTDSIDKIAELMNRLGCSFPEAADYVVTEEEKYSAATWSSVRDVRERQVNDNADNVREMLLDNADAHTMDSAPVDTDD